MSKTPASRRLIRRLLVGVLVSTQMVIAANACSGVSGMPMIEEDWPANAAIAPDPRVAAHPRDDLGADCRHLDPALPSLYIARGQYGQQSADDGLAPAVPAALLTSYYKLPPHSASSVRVGAASRPNGRPAAVDPPHAILHCCFRI